MSNPSHRRVTTAVLSLALAFGLFAGWSLGHPAPASASDPSCSSSPFACTTTLFVTPSSQDNSDAAFCQGFVNKGGYRLVVDVIVCDLAGQTPQQALDDLRLSSYIPVPPYQIPIATTATYTGYHPFVGWMYTLTSTECLTGPLNESGYFVDGLNGVRLSSACLNVTCCTRE